MSSSVFTDKWSQVFFVVWLVSTATFRVAAYYHCNTLAHKYTEIGPKQKYNLHGCYDLRKKERKKKKSHSGNMKEREKHLRVKF